MNQYFVSFLVFSCLLFLTLNSDEKPAVKDPKVIPVSTAKPVEKHLYPIAIIGAGAAGTMAANRSVLNNIETLVFAGANQERRRSRGNWVRTIDNIPGLEKYSRAVLELRNDALEELVKGPLAHNLFVVEDSIYSIEKHDDHFQLTDGAGNQYLAKYVVLATGIMDEQPHIQGSIRPILKYANGQTVAYCSVCDGHRCFGKKTAVIGHSESAGSIACLLHEKYMPNSMVILTNGHKGEFSEGLLEKLQSKNIEIFNEPIEEVLGHIESKQLLGFKLQSGASIDAEMGFVALGIRPNNQLALQLNADVDSSGLVIADAHGETSVPGLFVAGDLRANSLKQIYTAWQQAVESVQQISLLIRFH